MTEQSKSQSKPEPKPAAEPKSAFIRLVAKNEELHVIGIQVKDGWRTYVQHRRVEGKKSKLISRGATATHETLAQARRAMDALVATAEKAGWVRKRPTAGFRSQPDVFTAASLPKHGGKDRRSLLRLGSA